MGCLLMGTISTDPSHNLQACPRCGGSRYNQPPDLFIRNRVRCAGCGAEYDRRALWLATQEEATP
jgi:hypothetical protein